MNPYLILAVSAAVAFAVVFAFVAITFAHPPGGDQAPPRRGRVA